MSNEYHDRYNQKYQSDRMAEYIAILGGACVRCGSTERLQFDHIDPATKEFTIATRVRRSRHLVIQEIKKCQLLCSPCHLAKTNTERYGRPAGIARTKEWKSEYNRAYKLKHKKEK